MAPLGTIGATASWPGFAVFRLRGLMRVTKAVLLSHHHETSNIARFIPEDSGGRVVPP